MSKVIKKMIGYKIDFFIDFGRILEGFGRPSWTKNLLKIDKKSIWRHLEASWPILEPLGASKVVQDKPDRQ